MISIASASDSSHSKESVQQLKPALLAQSYPQASTKPTVSRQLDEVLMAIPRQIVLPSTKPKRAKPMLRVVRRYRDTTSVVCGRFLFNGKDMVRF
jgi:hypothetical protein